jgi:hypothetical protein
MSPRIRVIQRRVLPVLTLAVLLTAISACTPSTPPTTAPTQVLSTTIPTITPTPTELPVEVTPEAAEPIDARSVNGIIDEMAAIELASRDAATRADSAAGSVQVAQVEAINWQGDASCTGTTVLPTPEASLTPVFAESDPDNGYRITLVIGERVYEYQTRADVESETGLQSQLCAQFDLYSERPDLFIALDPIAGELNRLAVERVASELDLPQTRVQLVSAEPMVWEDASLGCPFEDQFYALQMVEGYRFVLEAAGNRYEFHSNYDRLVLCDSDLVPTITPTPTSTRTPTPTLTPTVTRTSTPTSTPTVTPTRTPSRTPTATEEEAASETPAAVTTRTVTRTPGRTPSATPANDD